MVIAKDQVVAINYTLKNDKGETIDSSEGRGPLVYLHGHGNIIPGLESELEGKTKGTKLQVSVSPEEAYGVRNEQMVQAVPKSQFDGIDNLSVGMQFQLDTPQGPMVVTAIEVRDEEVVLDGNHPLAGETLHFDVEVHEVRAGTDEEISHGHVHGEGGHQH